MYNIDIATPMKEALNVKHIHRYGKHFGFSYPVSTQQKIYTIIVAPLAIIVVLFLILKLFLLSPAAYPYQDLLPYMGLALVATFLRLLAAYALALLVALPLALLIYWNQHAERILLPLYDIIESVPVLAFFPVIIILFIKFNFLNGAAIFIIFLGMLWNIVFSVVGGLKSIPSDIKSAALVFNIRGSSLVRRLLLPAVFPNIVTGSLLAWAQGWNIIIVAEVLHTYIPGGLPRQDLFGIGSILVNASASGQNSIFLLAIFLMMVLIGFINFFIWQKLLQYAEKYKFE